MRCYKIKTDSEIHGPIDIAPTLDSYYREIGCDCIDIAIRSIGDCPLNIVLDDEGLLKPNRVTAKSTQTGEVLAGTLLVFGVRDDLELRSLTDDEIRLIRSRVMRATYADGSIWPALFYTR